MRYRKLDENGDYTFGQGSLDFYIDTPEAPGQAVKTRLALFLGEWFVDNTEGTDWNGGVLGYNTAGSRDLTIQEKVLGTPGVTEIVSYNSALNPQRQFMATMTIDTAYGITTVPVSEPQ